LPYFVLRKCDREFKDVRGIRQSGRFFPHSKTSRSDEFFYKAQTSLLILGPDEFFWTAYCCVDTYYDSHENEDEYDNETIAKYARENLDGPTGGAKHVDSPVWNPREYFLLILARRLEHATIEWGIIVHRLDEYFQENYVCEDARVLKTPPMKLGLLTMLPTG
jgi:hypothetical protein